MEEADEGAQIQGHWVDVLGQGMALVLLVLQGMLVLLDAVLQGRVLVLQDRVLVLQDRVLEGRGRLGPLQEAVGGSPRKASLGAGGQRGSGCCRRTRHQLTVGRGERRSDGG